MKHWLPLALLLAMWVLVLAIFVTFFIEQPQNSHGFQHPTIPHMDQGGDGRERHSPVLFLGWLLGSVMLAIFICLLVWGVIGSNHGRNDSDPPTPAWRDGYFFWGFLIGGLLYEGAFTMLCLSYYRSLENSATTAFWGPFPIATSWMVFGIWLTPAVFVLLYILFYYRWILPSDTLQRFETLVDQWKKTTDH